MAIAGKKSVGNDEAGARNTRTELRLAAWESDVVDAENVANGIAVTVQDDGGHGLLLFQLLYFARELLHLFLEFVLLRIDGLHDGIEAGHHTHADEQEQA